MLPTEADCRPCHAIDRAAPSEAACGLCHRGFRVGGAVATSQTSAPALKFAHAAHQPAPCASCHPMTGPTGAPQQPTMASCLTCHRQGAAASRCTLCHLATPTGLLDVALGDGESDGPARSLRPSSDLFGDAHRPGFATDHRAAATRGDRTCGACHRESYCTDCHAGSVRPMEFHPAEYLAVHAVEARRAASECSTCHRYQSFCVGCHERVGVGARAASEWRGSDGASRFHPVGWVSSEGGDNRHGRAARQNLTACVSCHREDDCRPCHSAEGTGLHVSPHPPGWRGSAQCQALDRGNRRMCLRCHISDQELGCDWRGASR